MFSHLTHTAAFGRRQYLSQPRCMLACLNDWFHGERKHMEERRARQSRQVGGHQTHIHERERELSIHVARGDP